MSSRVCLICAVPILTPHLRIEACRACASFYKRTQIAGRTFICRSGDGKCTILARDKFMCRSCRYDKCVEYGMVYHLPPQRKPRMRKNEDAITDSPSSTDEKESLIDRVADVYRLSVERRLVLERAYIAEHNLKPFTHSTEEFYIGNFESFYGIFRLVIKESLSLVQSVFDNFEELPTTQRVALFKNFFSRFIMAECVYLTSKHFKNEAVFMASLITIAELDDMAPWVVENDKIADKVTFLSSAKQFTSEFEDILMPLIKLDSLTENEFFALTVLSCCDVDTSLHFPEEIITSAHMKRTEVFNELQEYYRNELKLNDFSQRLGNLMTIVHGTAEAGKLMHEEMRLYSTVFDFCSGDRLLAEFFNV